MKAKDVMEEASRNQWLKNNFQISTQTASSSIILSVLSLSLKQHRTKPSLIYHPTIRQIKDSCIAFIGYLYTIESCCQILIFLVFQFPGKQHIFYLSDVYVYMMQMAELLNRTKNNNIYFIIFLKFLQFLNYNSLAFKTTSVSVNHHFPTLASSRTKIGTGILGKHSNKQTRRSNVNMV